ncbi:hypothetical protein BZL39_L05190 [Zygosaccharomyces parabailii]|nr:hypothetical protein BZL39_L05190 [Zygosaccharomyces parabailii]CDH09990.1 uncharacterized protein ZBAI_01775 [Zygosaccharomyces bailii ISA1307]
MFRTIASKSILSRVSQRTILQRGCLKRYVSGGASNQQNAKSSAALSLGAVVTVGALLFVSPLDMKSMISKKRKELQEPTQDSGKSEEHKEPEKPAEEKATEEKNGPEEEEQQSQESKRDEQKPNEDIRKSNDDEQDSSDSEKGKQNDEKDGQDSS